MRTRFDQFAKQLIAAHLARAGHVETERETSAEPQTVDVWFRPDRTRGKRLGSSLFRWMARTASLIEPFHQAPSVDEILACVGKQQAVHAELRRAEPRADRPALWILSAGRPHRAIGQLGLVPLRRAGAGVYTAAPGLHLRLVVISALPRTRHTLLLRMLGAGRTFRDALDELQRLPADAWEAALTRPWLVRYQLEIKTLDPAERTVEEEAIMAAQKAYEDLEREWLQRGIERGTVRGKALGRDEGKREMLLRQLTARFGRVPPQIEQRIETASSQQLDAWAERVLTAASLDDTFAG